MHKKMEEYWVYIYAFYAVVAHVLLGLVGTLVYNLIVPKYSWSYILHVLTSLKLYWFVAVCGGSVWVGLVVLTQMVRWLVHRRWVQCVVIMLVASYWQSILALLGWLLIGTPFVWQQLVIFPLLYGWSPAILLWLIYRHEKKLEASDPEMRQDGT